MARPLRIQFPGAIYHVISRGNARAPIFLDDHDRRAFLAELTHVAERLDWWYWAYCLMGNHYHLVVETVQPTLSRGMRDLNGNYSLGFNRRHGRIGHLFQGRYRGILIDKDGYLPHVIRYVVMNPVRAGLVETPHGWYWSSFLATADLADRPPRLAARKVLALFDPNPDRAPQTFADTLGVGTSEIDWVQPDRNRTGLGSSDFVRGLGTYVDHPSPEVPRSDRTWKSLASYEREATSRNAAIHAAYADGLHSIRAIADYFGLHYTTVSRIVHSRQNAAIQDLTP